KALTDLGHLDVQEPFERLFTQGMITKDGAKMSKSKGNVVSPQALVDRYGADTARAYILFIGPPDQDADWSDEGVEGVYKFLGRRVWEEPWPFPDQSLLERDTYELVCQVNGKVRDRVQAATGASDEELVALCLAAPNVQTHVNGKEVIKRVVVPGKLVNLVAR